MDSLKKFVVAFLSLHDGSIKQEIVEAKDEVAAIKSYLNWGDIAFPEDATLQDIYETVYNSDCYISVMDLDKELRARRSGSGLQTRVAQFDSEAAFQ